MEFLSPFSPHGAPAEYLAEVFAVIADLMAGKINIATGRWKAMQRLQRLRISGELADPQAIDLMLKTEVALRFNRKREAEGNGTFARYSWPAWELIQIGYSNTQPDGPDTREGEWARRWLAAGESVGWDGALLNPMVALKISPIWRALAAGAGNFRDVLGHPFPPFALGSGKDWRAVPREECAQLGLIEKEAASRKSLDDLTPEQYAKLVKRLSQ
jgi:hypothetical protein